MYNPSEEVTMAKYKSYSYQQTKLIPISFEKQIEEGTFEYALNYIVDHEMDLSVFESKYNNDKTGAPAWDPAIMIKIVLYAYSKGIISSRKIAQACDENVIFMALSGDSHPHFTIHINHRTTKCIQVDLAADCFSGNAYNSTFFLRRVPDSQR